MTPREELMVAGWETRRMLAALLSGDVEGAVVGLARLLLAGVALAGVVVAVVWVS